VIGIIGAMEVEIEKIKSTILDQKKTTISGIEFVSGKTNGQNVVVAVCGVGKVFAAICAQTMILKFSPSIVINIGVAGTLSKNLKIGDIAIADYVVQHDMNTSGLGDPIGMISGINIIKIPCSKDITRLIKNCADKLHIHSEVGTIASGDQFLNDNTNKELLVKRFDALACEMEGASIGQVCYVNKVEFAVIRAISDGADEESNLEYNNFLHQAANNSLKVIDMFIHS
jgi:adenosylhomocysteine nucleosidase